MHVGLCLLQALLGDGSVLQGGVTDWDHIVGEMKRHNAGTADELVTVLTRVLHFLASMIRAEPGKSVLGNDQLFAQLLWFEFIKIHNAFVVSGGLHSLMSLLAGQAKKVTTV